MVIIKLINIKYILQFCTKINYRHIGTIIIKLLYPWHIYDNTIIGKESKCITVITTYLYLNYFHCFAIIRTDYFILSYYIHYKLLVRIWVTNVSVKKLLDDFKYCIDLSTS